MATGAKHVVLLALVALLLTCAECRQGSFRQGRQDLSNYELPETTPVLGHDLVTETDGETFEDTTLTPTFVEPEEEPSEEAAEFFSEEPLVKETEELLPTDDDSFNLEGHADDVGEVQTEQNVDWFAEAQEDSEEGPLEGRDMLEATSPAMAPLNMAAMSPQYSAAAEGPDATIVDPDSSNYPDPLAANRLSFFLQSLNQKNAVYASMEPKIQQCIQDENCGTP